MPGQRPLTDHYAVLGVSPSASGQQITTAYRRLVRSLHPDTADAAAATHDAFAAVVTAYNVLHDPRQRAAYDADRARRGTPSRPQGSGQPIPVRVHRSPGPSLTGRAPSGYSSDGYPVLLWTAHDLSEQILRWLRIEVPWL
ncbi:J domain-containing protein [Streptomyces orinoci]|uniref:J domain-containing protein n=1 Tax=Streptomyces orinoci TaxID=67339 RepID=A0ABV3JUT8_STRON|nr:J domain-containing protein [Streptomyces orinoci]